MEYASENDLTIIAFLWATWLEEDADGINILIITPEREAQEERMKEYVKHASPARMGSDCAYYPAFILRKAWEACTRTDAPVTAGVHEVTKLKLIPALRDIIQKGDFTRINRRASVPGTTQLQNPANWKMPTPKLILSIDTRRSNAADTRWKKH